MSQVRPGWVVLKFGGTSVSSRSVWQKIAAIAADRLSEVSQVLIVHSALSKVTDQLEALLHALAERSVAAESGSTIASAPGVSTTVDEALARLHQRHWQLADELGVDP